MRMVMAPIRIIRGLVGATLVTIVTIVLVAVALVALIPLGIALAAVLYVKRDAWTLPAYRWARDQSGRLGFTSWSSGDGGAA
jgi:hypothetical protein